MFVFVRSLLVVQSVRMHEMTSFVFEQTFDLGHISIWSHEIIQLYMVHCSSFI